MTFFPDYEGIVLQKILISFSRLENTPRFNLSCDRVIAGAFQIQIATVACNPAPFFLDASEKAIWIFGNPILGEKIDRVEAAKILAAEKSASFPASLLSRFNGEFLFVCFDKKQQKISVINDRFGAYPFFYRVHQGALIGSFSFNDLWLYQKKQGLIDLDPATFFEVLCYRRAHAERTLEKNSFYLPVAHCLEFDGTRLQQEAYWKPSYEKKRERSVAASAETLAMAMQQSVARKKSDGKRIGLFLSGGLDARLVLAAMPEAPVCFNISYTTEGNRDHEGARALAAVKKAKFIHLGVPANHFSRIYPYALAQMGGMHPVNSIFLGYRSIVQKDADVSFHGHGLDYMFQGMYLPTHRPKVGNWALEYKRIRPFKKELVSEFMNGISYRLKFPGIYDFVLSEWRESLRDTLRERFSDLLKKAATLSDDVYDQWDYLSFHALSRHYSYSDYTSMHLNAEQRTVCFDNDLYDLYLSLPKEQRFDGVVFRRALKILSPELHAVKNANNNYPVCSSLERTRYQIADYFLKKVGIQKRKGVLPSHYLRTWPTHEWVLRNEAGFMERLLQLGNSKNLKALGWLDLERLKNTILVWRENPAAPGFYRFGDFLWTLLGFDAFLNQKEA